MVKAYIAVANAFGLQALIHDSQPVLALITSPKELTPSQHRACFWAAVRDDVAEQIRKLLLAGNHREALLTLDSLATDIAPIGWREKTVNAQSGQYVCDQHHAPSNMAS